METGPWAKIKLRSAIGSISIKIPRLRQAGFFIDAEACTNNSNGIEYIGK